MILTQLGAIILNIFTRYGCLYYYFTGKWSHFLLFFTVASRVLKQKGLQLDNTTIEISRHSSTTPRKRMPAHPDLNMVESRLDTVEIKGMSGEMTKDHAMLFFEMHGGGPIKRMQLEEGTATIIFEKSQGTKEV